MVGDPDSPYRSVWCGADIRPSCRTSFGRLPEPSLHTPPRRSGRNRCPGVSWRPLAPNTSLTTLRSLMWADSRMFCNWFFSAVRIEISLRLCRKSSLSSWICCGGMKIPFSRPERSSLVIHSLSFLSVFCPGTFLIIRELTRRM